MLEGRYCRHCVGDCLGGGLLGQSGRCIRRSGSGMRARVAALCVAAAAVMACAGCTGTAAHPQASRSPGSPAVPAAPVLPARGLPSPGCSTATATAPLLNSVRTAMVSMPGSPFGVAVTTDGRWAFVAVNGSIEVLRVGTSLAPVESGTILAAGDDFGETLTADGRYLLAASGSGAVVVSVARAEQGRPGAVLGTLNDPTGGFGGIEVAVSPDGGYAFVTEEDSDRAVVFNLRRALTHGFGPADYVGSIPLGIAPVGMAVSPDGRWLYMTSEVAVNAGIPHPAGNQGTLTVVSLPRAETDPAASVVATVAAGCNPVRVVTSADGSQVWVTARASDDLLCFSAAALAAHPARALTAIVRVGEAPVGLMLVRDGSLVVVADSNRFNAPGASADLSVVDVAAALAGRPAVIGSIPAGQFPREMALVPGGQRLLVSNYLSGQLEAISVPSIP
jgi:DNA-binding beta-propeller fold protein YncE